MATSVKKSEVRTLITSFEKALKRATDDDGRVDMAALKGEANKAQSKQLKAAIKNAVSTLEDRFARSRTVSNGCGSSIQKVAPASLTAREVGMVFAALVEAKSRGLDKLDGDKDGRITSSEARDWHGRTLAVRIAEAAAQAAVDSTRRPSRPSPPSTPTPPSTGGSSGGSCGGSIGGSGGAGC